MKHILIFALFLAVGKTIYSQEMQVDSLLTAKQNTQWIAQFEKLTTKSKQIAEIKKKIYDDSIYIRQNGYNRIGCRIIIKNKESIQEALEKANCECKIVFVLAIRKDGYLLDPIEYPKTNKILELMSEENIHRVNILKGINAIALYGTDARCGVVVISSDSRKFKRKVKNVF